MDALAVKESITQATLYNINELSQSDVERLFVCAKKAHQDLAKYNLKERIRELEKVFNYIRDNRDSIIDKIVAETGKCRTDALLSEIMGVLDYIEWLMHSAPKILADEKAHTPITLMGKKSRIYHEPLGVVLVISPWNYPFHIGMLAVVTGFIAGNGVIFKPSEVTPLQGLFKEVFSASLLVQQCVQIAYGSGKTAEKIIAQRPDKIFFTGSARTGKKILAQAAELIIPVELELGGKDPMIIFDDITIDRVVAGALWGALTNAGQSCTSVEALYVQDTIYDDFVNKLKIEAEKLVINAGDEGGADYGAMTVKFQLDIVKEHIADAREKEANIICGGNVIDEDSMFYLPTIVTNITTDMKIVAEETFGPVIPVFKFSSEQEVTQMANSTNFGLSASVWSKDLNRANRVARALEVGAVSINNVMMTEGNPALPFGGAKNSGFGRIRGAEGLLGYTRSKAVLIDKDSKKIEANWYPYTKEKYHLFNQFINAIFIKSPLKLIKFAMTGLKLESFSQKPRS